jgi:hypothetical protein
MGIFCTLTLGRLILNPMSAFNGCTGTEWNFDSKSTWIAFPIFRFGWLDSYGASDWIVYFFPHIWGFSCISKQKFVNLEISISLALKKTFLNKTEYWKLVQFIKQETRCRWCSSSHTQIEMDCTCNYMQWNGPYARNGIS